jgi:hypothetical protein
MDYQKAYEQYKKIGGSQAQVKTTSTESQKTPTIQKIFNIFRISEFVIGGLLSGISPIEGIKRKVSPSDALGISNGVAKLATDILLDPTTYITFGAGSGAKILTKTGSSIALTKSGTKAFNTLAKDIGSQEARKQFANIIIKNPEYIDKSGLKFMGKTMIPKSSFDKLGKTIKDTATKVPILNSAGKKIEEVIDVFNPLYAIKKNPKLADYIDKRQLLVKGIGAKQIDAIENIAKKEEFWTKKYGKDFSTNVSKYIENVDSLKDVSAKMSKDVKSVGDNIIEIQKGIARNELSRDILKSTLGATAFKALPKNVKTVVEKYTDDILNGTIKSVDDFKKILTKEESKALGKKYSATKLFNKIKSATPNVDNYLRHVLTEKGRKYVESKGMDFMNSLSKPLRVNLKAGNTRTYRKSIEEINKEMRAKVGGDMFETDAFKSLAYRYSESIKAIDTYDFLKGVESKYGIKALPGETSRFIDGMKYVPSKNKLLEGTLLPEAIARNVDDTLNVLTGDKATKAFLKGYDNLLNFWKGSVTGWFPAFHTRNFIGGVFNNWLAGLNPKYYAMGVELQRDLKKGGNKIWISSAGESFTSNQLIKIIKETGAINQPGMIDVMKNVEDIVSPSVFKKLGNAPKNVMEAVENNLRIPLFMDRFLGRGYSAADSAKDVFKFHFDYAPEGLTNFERNWMRRIVPFYTWTRNNIPLQIEQMIKQPGKYAVFPKLQDDIGGKIGEEEFQDLPEWMKEMLVIRIGEQGGNALWLQLNLPLEDISNLPVDSKGVKNLVSIMSPILKLPLELVTNKNLFFGTDIVNPDLPKEFQTAKTIKQLDLLPQPIKDFINFKKVQYKTREDGKVVWKDRYEMDAVKLHILQSTVGRFYSTIGQAFDEDRSFVNKMTKLLGGMPATEVDIETQKYWNTYNKEKIEKAVKQYERLRKE